MSVESTFMAESDETPVSPTGMPHISGHRHADVSGGWLRAATFGAMDGLVSNTALIAGVGAPARAHTAVVLSGVAGLLAGAFSMALGRVHVGHDGQRTDRVRGPGGAARIRKVIPRQKKPNWSAMFVDDGHDAGARPRRPSEEIHRDEDRALNLHLAQELGVDPQREAVAVGRRRILVRDVRDRRNRPADPVSARIRIPLVGSDLRRRRPVDRGRGGGADSPASQCGGRRCGSWLSARSRSPPLTSSDRLIGTVAA